MCSHVAFVWETEFVCCVCECGRESLFGVCARERKLVHLVCVSGRESFCVAFMSVGDMGWLRLVNSLKS